MTTATLDYRRNDNGYTNPFQGIVTGVSDTARFIATKISDIHVSRLGTITGSEQLSLPSKAFRELLDLSEETDQLSLETFREAIAFLQTFPAGFPIPEAGFESSGAIAFEWYKSPFKTFVISLNGTQKIEYAALIGRGNELHGKMNFNGTLPLPIKTLLEIFLSA